MADDPQVSETESAAKRRKRQQLTPVGDVDLLVALGASDVDGQEAAGDEGRTTRAALPVADLRKGNSGGQAEQWRRREVEAVRALLPRKGQLDAPPPCAPQPPPLLWKKSGIQWSEIAGF